MSLRPGSPPKLWWQELSIMPPRRQPGHRQKGAGTVTVSRGDQLRQGLLVKEWQRTPMQLLQQYCQSKKRINARYVHARAPEGRFRMRCVLPDDKSSAKDLAFCPEQDFDTMDDAKHCAALLALRHFEPLRPLERQLPEPYDKLWLSLVKEVAPGGSAAAPAEAKKTGGRGRGKKEKEEKTARSATGDGAAAGDAKAEEKTDMDLWANAPAEEEKEADKKKDKTRVLPSELTSDRKFASRAEYQQAQLERAQQRNDKQRARENRERANPFKQVFMSASCREMIEGVLKRLGVVSDTHTGATGEMQPPEVPVDHEAFYEKATKQLESIGFQAKHVQGALQACRKQPDHSDDEFLTMILDWLCLNVPEGELPKGFNPEGTQLDVVITNNAAMKAKTSSPLASVLVQRLMKFGYDRMDAVAIANDYVTANADKLDVSDESPSDEVVLRVVGSSMRHLLTYLSLETAAAAEIPSDEELQQMREDEMFALEAIYDDKLQRQVLENGDQILVLQLADETVQLEVLLPHDSKYPFEFPVFGVTSKGGSKQNQLLVATANALKSSATILGDPMIYDLCVSVESTLTGKPSKERIVLLKSKPSPVQKQQGSAPPPAPVRSEKSNAKVSQSNTKKPRKAQPQAPTRRGPSAEQIKQLSDKLLQLRQAKDKREEFQQMLRARARLPAAKEKESVLQYMVTSQVLLICGQTGCGKTTQIPQFILDDFIDNGRGGECNIVCTQPRRIAAIGVATRVAQERCEDIADVVGYQIRMDAKKSQNTRLLFCTTGVLLRRLLTDRSLSGVSHVIVDEVHERNVDTDFLLSILRDLLPSRPDLRVILMSATMNAQLFVDYFSKVTKAPCPVLDIPGFTFPVENHFLEDVLALTKYQVPKKMLLNKKKSKPQEGDAAENEAGATGKSLSAMQPEELVQLIDDSRIDYDMCAHVIKHIVDQNANAQPGTGAVLVFLPGTAEIKRLMEMLTSNRELASRVWVLPLHGSLSGADQAQVFRFPPKGKTKVIISTNIAETSITINDITAVVDCGKVKEMVYDAQLRRSQLLDCWASQAACDQRKGRAGRVQAGTCYRLFSRNRFAKMDAQLSAEIHRVSLEQLCLQIKKLELGSIRGFLSKAIEPPKQAAIDAAMQELIAIAAFKPIDEDERAKRHQSKLAARGAEEVRLTPLGNHLAMLPLDARIGKFLIYGSILRCIDPVAIIAACISSKSPFVMSMNDPEVKERQDALKKELGAGSKSDHLLLARLVIDRYEPLKGQKAKRGFCKEYALSFDTLESIVELKSQYLNQLDVIGFYERSKHEDLNENASVARIVKAALCAGLYANIIQVMYPEQKYFQSAHGVFTEDHDAKKIRYFVRSNVDLEEKPSGDKKGSLPPRERVFMHPSSCNFTQTQYDSPWLLYTELVQTSKVFVRESTMVHPYALLLFGGKLDVHHEKNLLCLDDWIRFNAVARIGVLIKAIRRELDELLTQKIAQPELDIAKSELVTAISLLLKSEGM